MKSDAWRRLATTDVCTASFWTWQHLCWIPRWWGCGNRQPWAWEVERKGEALQKGQSAPNLHHGPVHVVCTWSSRQAGDIGLDMCIQVICMVPKQSWEHHNSKKDSSYKLQQGCKIRENFREGKSLWVLSALGLSGKHKWDLLPRGLCWACCGVL